ncbi:MAG: GH92 family glycosyl hydrolase [Bacteroidetes bacterium]|nr:GH92 family glycosyl hydrolase [Bacteroidota bacterium]
MKSWKIIVLLGLNTCIGFGQIPNLDKLRNAQDARKKIIGSIKNMQAQGPSKFVNTFIGTGGHGHTYPGASAPFGMMQLSPDTRPEGWDGCGGYHYDDSIVYGFSHTHLSGTGVSDYADLLVCPQIGSPKTEPKFKDPNGYGHKFSHSSESASPGFYTVLLEESNIKVSLATTTRAGIHRYEFGNTAQDKYILLDLDYRDQLMDASFQLLSTNSLQGKRISKSWASEQHFYFYLETNVEWIGVKEITQNGRHKLLLKFPSSTPTILLRVGMSAVDENGAQQNLKKEIPSWNFELVKMQTAKEWDTELGKIDFYSSDSEIKTNFYTALYHSFLNPNVFQDVDGRYRGLDQKIHQLDYPDQEQYTVFSLWDTFRAAHPLFTITQQKRTKQFLGTFKRQYDQGGDLPVWELSANETECMIGYHSVSVITDAWKKGITTNEGPTFLEAMIKASNRAEFGKVDFQREGFISLNKEPESVSKSLEYAYDDYCIGQFAKAIGNDSVFKKYETSSFNFINHFDPKTGFFRARRSGSWFAPFQPEEVNFNYTEANAWQYSAFAPHAVGVLNQLHKASGGLEKHLTKMFNASTNTTGREQVDITGLIGQYAHGNEPSHHMAYLFNYLKRPDLTQKYVDQILREQYKNAPDGLAGNEDCGQMSAWYVLSAMGFYQVAPGNPYYDFGRPIADSIKLHFENGKTANFTIVNQAPNNSFIQKITRNGVDYKKSYFSHDELMTGGNWVIEMGAQPSASMTKYSSAPTVNDISKEFIPVPFFSPDVRIFDAQTEIQIQLPLQKPNWIIEYSVMQNDPWTTYQKPLVFKETTKLYARTIEQSTGKKSSVVEAIFTKNEKTMEMSLDSKFANQYSAGGSKALIDGIEGESEYRSGDWQGFFEQDVKFTLQPTAPKSKYTLQIGALEDLKSWVFYPKQLIIEYSTNGIDFKKIEKNLSDGEITEYRPSNRSTIEQLIESNEPIVEIRVTLKNSGNCPAWHLGAGNPTWLFFDEVKLK